MKFDWKVLFGAILWFIGIYPNFLLFEAYNNKYNMIPISGDGIVIIMAASIIAVTFFAFLAVILSLGNGKKNGEKASYRIPPNII